MRMLCFLAGPKSQYAALATPQPAFCALCAGAGVGGCRDAGTTAMDPKLAILDKARDVGLEREPNANMRTPPGFAPWPTLCAMAKHRARRLCRPSPSLAKPSGHRSALTPLRAAPPPARQSQAAIVDNPPPSTRSMRRGPGRAPRLCHPSPGPARPSGHRSARTPFHPEHAQWHGPRPPAVPPLPPPGKAKWTSQRAYRLAP